MKILIVDDDANNRKLLRLIFEKNGYHAITEAADGLEGIEKARGLRPDLIVSDALMPRMDGFQFLWAVKMDGDLREIPFVFHSSVYTAFRDEELAHRLGAEAYIVRPKDPEQFWAEMSGIMERIASGRRSPPPPHQLAEEKEYLRDYSQVVARKLEEKVLELEQTLERHRKAEQELRKLSLAVEQSPVSIVITDTSGDIEYVNPKFCQITGYTAREVVGQNPRILKSGEIPPEDYRKLWETISSGGVWSGELHNRRKNGELYWEAATIAPVRDLRGCITHYIAIKEDISERKKLEEQLLHAQKMEAVGTLAGGIAHDFNNILTAFLGYTSILKMKMKQDDPLQEHVSHLQQAAERAAGLTASLLACSRKQKIDAKVLDLNDVVAGIRSMLSRLIREDIELRVYPAPLDMPVLADQGQLEQVLLNLTTNASDAMGKGGVITISTTVTDLGPEAMPATALTKPGRYALLTFSDNGSGMEEAVRQRIFDPFFTTKEVGKGTGLGLAICYGIIKQHEGHLECHSHPGEGTSFLIYLPLAERAEERVEPSVPSLQPGGGETILLAEDDPGAMGATSEILSLFGYKVIPAFDGDEAVAVYRDRWHDIDLCLLDVVMPKRRGCEVMELIRGINPKARVLFMSGYSDDVTSLHRLLREGADFIPKPLAAPDLLRKVRQMLALP